jgi:hypothetical protein
MASYETILLILKSWGGTPQEMWQKWEETYDSIIPPPPDPPWTVESLARWIADHYQGTVPGSQT